MDFLTDKFLVDRNNFSGPVLVTGAGGCIGAWVVAILARSGINVIASDLSSNKSRAALILGDTVNGLIWEQCDVTDFSALKALAIKHDISAIIHLAGLQVPFCAANPALGARVNVEGTINVFQCARDLNIAVPSMLLLSLRMACHRVVSTKQPFTALINWPMSKLLASIGKIGAYHQSG